MDKRPQFAPVSQFSLDDYENLGKQQESLQNQKNAFYGPMPSAVDLQEQEHNAIREKYTKRQQIDMDRAEYEKNPSSANMSTARGLDAYISSTARKENPDFYKQDRKSNTKEKPQAQGPQEEVSTSSSNMDQGQRISNNSQGRNIRQTSGGYTSNSPENELGNTVPKGGTGGEAKNPKPKDTTVKPKPKDTPATPKNKDKTPDSKAQVESVYNRLDVKGERRPSASVKRDESAAAGYNSLKGLDERPVVYDEKGFAKDKPAVEGGFWDWAEKNPGKAFLAGGVLTAAAHQMYRKLNGGNPAPHNLGPNAKISKNLMNTPVSKVNPSNRIRPIPKGGSSNAPAQGALKIKRSPISNPSPAPASIPKIKPPAPKPPAALPTSAVPKNKPVDFSKPIEIPLKSNVNVGNITTNPPRTQTATNMTTFKRQGMAGGKDAASGALSAKPNETPVKRKRGRQVGWRKNPDSPAKPKAATTTPKVQPAPTPAAAKPAAAQPEQTGGWSQEQIKALRASGFNQKQINQITTKSPNGPGKNLSVGNTTTPPPAKKPTMPRTGEASPVNATNAPSGSTPGRVRIPISNPSNPNINTGNITTKPARTQTATNITSFKRQGEAGAIKAADGVTKAKPKSEAPAKTKKETKPKDKTKGLGQTGKKKPVAGKK